MHVRRLLLRRLDRLPELRPRARRSLARHNQRLPHNSLLYEQLTLYRHPDGQVPRHFLFLAVFSCGERDGDGCDGSVSESDGRGLVLYANWCARPGSDYWERDGGYEDWQRGVGIHEYGIEWERE
jgi:hypothetical protein